MQNFIVDVKIGELCCLVSARSRVGRLFLNESERCLSAELR